MAARIACTARQNFVSQTVVVTRSILLVGRADTGTRSRFHLTFRSRSWRIRRQERLRPKNNRVRSVEIFQKERETDVDFSSRKTSQHSIAALLRAAFNSNRDGNRFALCRIW